MDFRTFGRRAGVTAAALLASGAALAHPGHGAALSIGAGLAHPFGADHLLAMLAVGMWSAAALPAGRRWLGPVAFLGAMTLGAALAMAGLAPSFVETGIAATLLLLGVMLAAATRVPATAGLALVATAASLHGLAHGAELPAGASALGYAVGFLATTALLHGGGVGLGLALRRHGATPMRAIGAVLGTTGLVLIATRL